MAKFCLPIFLTIVWLSGCVRSDEVAELKYQIVLLQDRVDSLESRDRSGEFEWLWQLHMSDNEHVDQVEARFGPRCLPLGYYRSGDRIYEPDGNMILNPYLYQDHVECGDH